MCKLVPSKLDICKDTLTNGSIEEEHSESETVNGVHEEEDKEEEEEDKEEIKKEDSKNNSISEKIDTNGKLSSEDVLSSKTVFELRKMLTRRKLPTIGRKAQLIERLRKFDES